MAVTVLGVADEGFIAELRDRGVIPTAAVSTERDIVFYEADQLEDLERLPELRDAIKPDGAVWVVSPKGKGAVLKDTDVMAAAHSAGFVVPKVASFSDTHTALKLVIPKADRKR